MRLLKLYSNKESFKTVEFNPSGLSIIVGKMEDRVIVNRKNTYNGVGKSLVIALVNFCLGSNANENLTKPLNDWDFYLDFQINDEKYTVKRKMNDPNKILLNNTLLSLDSYRDTLEQLVFDIPDKKISFLKFRSLISRFLRPYRTSYESYDKSVVKESDYARQLCNAFLLGLNPQLAERKYLLKKDLDDAGTFSKNIKKDEILNQFFQEGKKVDFEIVDLNRKISTLDRKIKTFIIAEDFDLLKKEADNLSYELRNLRNKRVVLENTIKNIEKSLNIQPDISAEELINFYIEAHVQLGQIVIKEIEAVESFNKRLLTDRKKRLENERRNFLLELNQIKIQIEKLGKLEDEKLKILDSTGALDDYKLLMDELGRLKNKLEKFETYKKLMEEYEIKQSKLEKDLSEENINSINYLHSQKELIDNNILTFQSLAQQFYEDKRSGIDISNNDGKNQTRYNISAEIQDAASDGINQVRLFCFDFTLLKNRHNHNVKFLFHDSRMLSEMDPRSRATVFEIAYNETLYNDFQYIITVNEDLLESFKGIIGEIEYEKMINNKTIILSLTDKSNDSKLLGMQIDMDYENDKKMPHFV